MDILHKYVSHFFLYSNEFNVRDRVKGKGKVVSVLN
jgi:hypothetical protein